MKNENTVEKVLEIKVRYDDAIRTLQNTGRLLTI